MKLCVVGNGPSAKGQGSVIDACDFVVRIKAWWTNGAEDAGVRCDALAYYGCPSGWENMPIHKGEHWITHTASHFENTPKHLPRLRFISEFAGFEQIRWMTDLMWRALQKQLGGHPSTGIVSVAMGLAIIQPDELVLYGFDSTTVDSPNYWDARPTGVKNKCHKIPAEKRALAEIGDGMWLGKPTGTKLIWPDMPEL